MKSWTGIHLASMSLAPDGAKAAIKAANFEWNDSKWSIPDFTFEVAPGEPRELGLAIAEHIKASSYEVFARLFGDPKQWMAAVRAGFIKGWRD